MIIKTNFFEKFFISLLPHFVFLTILCTSFSSFGQQTLVVDPTGSGNYTTIQGAFDAINNSTITQPIKIRIKPGTYNELLTLDSISGTSATNTITIESFNQDTSEVLIYYDSVSFFQSVSSFNIIAVENVIIQHLTFRIPTEDGYTIGLSEGIGSITIQKNHFYSSEPHEDYAAIGLRFEFNVDDYDLGDLTIQDNICENAMLFSRYVTYYKLSKLVLRRNKTLFELPSSDIAMHSGENIEISDNEYINTSIGYFSDVIDLKIQRNICVSEDAGINLSLSEEAQTALIANNFLSIDASTAIFVGSGDVNIWNNNILLTNSSYQGFAIYCAIIDSVSILNNIFEGKSDAAIGLYMPDTVLPSSFTCDYNNYYFPKGYYTRYYGGNQGTLYTTDLDKHKSFYKMDSNSVSFNPLFVSDSNLHIRNAALKNTGVYISGLTTDIDGDARNQSSPGIGADVISGSVDLEPSSFINFKGNFYPGKTMEIEYEGKNSGDLDLSSFAWKDAIYLSSDQTLDDNDIRIKELSNNFSVSASGTYTRKASVSIPYITGGTYYFILEVNKEKLAIEDTTNNVLVSSARVLPVPQLPNLIVDTIIVPQSIFSGKSFSLSFTIKNIGNAPTTGTWSDYIYMATNQSILQSSNLRVRDSLLQVKVSAPNGLKPNESYTTTKTFYLPIKFSGNVYYRVQTNGNLAIFEQDTTFQDNGRISDALNVNQSPLPDLTVIDLNIQSSAFSGDTVGINWTVKNVGQQKTYRTDRFYKARPGSSNPEMWYDRVVVSKKRFYDPKDKENVQKAFYVRPANEELDVDSSYTVQKDIVFDRCEYGKYYVFAITNYTLSTFELRFDNNVELIDSIELILQPNPDLKPVQLQVTNSLASGKTIDISYEVENDGFEDLIDENFNDRFYLHTSDSLIFTEAILVGTEFYNQDTLLKTSSYSKSPSFKLPYQVFGDYYLSVYTDNGDKVCESPNEDNNVKTIGPISIALSPQPDLVIDYESIPDTLIAGQNLQLIVETKNQGNAQVDQTNWYNRIYLKDLNTNRILKNYRLTPPLASGAISLDTINIVIPIDIKAGQFYFELETDYSNRIFEYGGENNNVTFTTPFTLLRSNGNVPDLEAISISVLGSNYRAGDVVSIEVKTKNNSRSTSQTGWLNAMTLVDNSGYGIASNEVKHIGRIYNGEVFTDTILFRLPYDKSGELSLEFDVNIKNNPIEYITLNNAKKVSIMVQAYIPPDLEPISLSGLACCNIYALQHDTLQVEVKNNGPGTIDNQHYIAKVYLSEDEFLDAYDYNLKTQQLTSSINSGSIEMLTIPVKYPFSLSGDYYYIVEIDSEDEIYEANNEDNNRYATGYTIVLRNEITDLSLDSIQISGYSGSSDKYISVDYTFSKPIPDSIQRNWTNSFVLSKDKISFPYETSLSQEEYSANLQSGIKFYSGSKVIYIPSDIEPGYYYVGMILDKDNVIYESSEGNNVRFSADSFYFDFSVPLTLDVLKDTFWYEGRFATDVYYNVQRPGGKGMIVNLTSSDKNASTEMYHRIGKIPSATEYDNKYGNPFLADQEILVSVTDTSVKDYVYLKAAYVPPVYKYSDPLNKQIDPVPYSIIANSAEYSIHSINPNNGGNFGITSAEISGFDFEPNTEFYLIGNGNDTIYTLSDTVASSSSAIVSFDLRDYSEGVYKLEANTNGVKTSLSNAFTVEDGGVEEPWVSINMPDVELTRRSAVLNVNFGNYANVNGYDYWLVIAMSNTKRNVDHLRTSYVGSSEEEMNEELGFTGNPPGDSTHIDIDGIRYFVYWLPNLAAKSQTTFTYLMNHSELDTTMVYALLYRKPMSGFTLSGNFADLGVSKTMYDLYDSYSESVGQRFKSNFECNNIDINKVQQELGNQTIKLAEHVHGGVTAYSGARSGRDMVKISYEQWKGDVLSIGDSKTQQEMLQNMVFKDKTVVDEIGDFFKKIDPRTNTIERFSPKKPPFSDLMKNVFKCLDTDPEFQKNIDRCIVSGSHPKYGTTYYNICDKKKAKNEDNFVTRWIKSFDPNEIEGPKGVTDLQYVNKEDVMPYIIRFENKSIATAPAVTVKIDNPLDASFRLQSFKLTEFGFGDTSFILDGSNNLNRTFDLGPKYNNQKLHIVAGLDLINNQAIWRITTIDPVTGNPIIDPFGGFLPPNDSTGRGEGYVKYEISLKSDVKSGTTVANQADIIFDENEIIPTNVWENIVVSSQPESNVNDLPTLSPPTFEVSWYGDDGDFGPGIQSYSVYVSKNDGAYEEWISNSIDTSALFIGEEDAEYRFYSVLYLLDGTAEEIPTTYDAITKVEKGSVAELDDKYSVLLYPNPGSSKLFIEQESNKPMEIIIRSIDGRSVLSYSLSGTKNSINVQELAKGLYVIECMQGKKRTVIKWIKN